jgi:hypothetical protein
MSALDKNVLKQWHKQQWRDPDVWSPSKYGSFAIWYGPAGPDGEQATMVEGADDHFTVTEYQNVVGLIDDPEADFSMHSVTIDAQDVFDTLKVAKITSKGRDLKGLFGWVAGLGVARLAYYGGEESWASELPR